MTPRLSYLVLRCADVEASRRFYEALGLSFVREQHGRGPVHYAADVGGVVLELYPARGQSTAGLRFELTIDGSNTDGADRVIEDPDGNVLDIRRGDAGRSDLPGGG